MKENYGASDFMADVVAEVEALKTNATKEELSRLDFDQLDPYSYYSCIYGQMTDDCTSLRSHVLISKCCKQLIDFQKFQLCDTDDAARSAVDIEIKTGVSELYRNDTTLKYISSIEAFIMLNDKGANEKIIAYLKGETNDLNL